MGHKMRILSDKKTGRILAFHSVRVRAEGDGAPVHVEVRPRSNQAVSTVEILGGELPANPKDFLERFQVRNGQLVAASRKVARPKRSRS